MKKAIQETNEKNPKELLKEAVRRANKKEKQEYEQISNRRTAITERVRAILNEYEELSEESERNKCPESTPIPDGKRIVAMPMEEFNKWVENAKRELHESSVWSRKTFSIMTKQMALIKELLELSTERLSLERKEKWLLLSVALRSQPNLLKYIENGDKR